MPENVEKVGEYGTQYKETEILLAAIFWLMDEDEENRAKNANMSATILDSLSLVALKRLISACQAVASAAQSLGTMKIVMGGYTAAEMDQLIQENFRKGLRG